MKNLKNTPELMTVICNIQAMKKIIYPYYDAIADFKLLENLPSEQLYSIQDNCIKDYNEALKN